MAERSFKFRAWDKINRVMHRYPVVPLLDGGISSKAMTDHSKNTYILMQSTGLHDKNGQEIFEGDIVDSGIGKKRFIEFVEYISGGFFPFMFASQEASDLILPNNCLVIGNIYENPELLEKN